MNPTSALDADRAVDPAAYALGGRAPRLALKPTSADEVASALAAASADGLRVVPWGGGTRIPRDHAPERYDVALDLSGLQRIVEYDPEDFTLTAECGVTLATLRQTLAARGQELPLESPHAARATLGGTLATNGSGPRRLRFGAPRDRILGARIALADGTRIKSGGKVVKNVAGYALHRLLCGARGRGGLILEASLKLAPEPETRVVLIYATGAGETERWRFLPRLEPAYLTLLGDQAAKTLPLPESGARFAIAIGLEDDAAWVAEQERAVVSHLGAPAMRLEGEEQSRVTHLLADAQAHAHPRITFTSAHNLPTAPSPLISILGAGHMVFHAAAGRLHWFPGGPGGALLPEGLALFHAFGFHPIESTGLRYERPVPVESAITALRRRIDQALDPLGTLGLSAGLPGSSASSS